MPISQVPFAGISNPVDFRNIVINGDMQLAQRSTSVASITTSGYYTVDRWEINISSMGTWTQSQSTDVPTGQGFANSLKMDCTAADASPSAGDQVVIEQKVEGQNLQYLKFGTANASSLTLSFWVKSNKTGTYCASMFNNDQSVWFSKQYTISASNTWEKKTLTFAGDITNAFNNDNGTSLRCRFWLGAGSTYTSGTITSTWTAESGNEGRLASGQVNLADDTANEWYITGVQLEAGEQASGFEFMPIDTNLERCQRYCYVFTEASTATDGVIGAGFSVNGVGGAFFIIYFPTVMRASPTSTFTTASHFEKLKFEDGWADVTALSLWHSQPYLIIIEVTSGQTDTRGLGTFLRIENASGKITLSSEL